MSDLKVIKETPTHWSEISSVAFTSGLGGGDLVGSSGGSRSSEVDVGSGTGDLNENVS